LRAESLARDSKRDGTQRKTGRGDTATFFHMKKRQKNQRARLTVQIFGYYFFMTSASNEVKWDLGRNGQEPEDVGPTRILGYRYFIGPWLVLCVALSVAFNR
ncbi:unnamed protein product, partial [Brassica oleracea var. botrytis]